MRAGHEVPLEGERGKGGFVLDQELFRNGYQSQGVLT